MIARMWKKQAANFELMEGQSAESVYSMRRMRKTRNMPLIQHLWDSEERDANLSNCQQLLSGVGRTEGRRGEGMSSTDGWLSWDRSHMHSKVDSWLVEGQWSATAVNCFGYAYDGLMERRMLSSRVSGMSNPSSSIRS